MLSRAESSKSLSAEVVVVVEVAERVDSTKGLIRLLQRESRDRSNKSVAEGQACLNGAGVVEKNEWKRASKRGERKK